MIISIFASIGQQNLGDELILKNEIKLLENEYGENTKFIVFTYDKKHPFFTQKNIVYKEYFPIGIRENKNIFRNLKNFFSFLSVVRKSDLIVLGGGGIIYDTENQANKSPLDLWLMRVKFFNFFKKHYVFFRGGIDIRNEENLPKLKQIFEKAEKIEVRDKNSFEILKKLGIESKIERDPVFYDNLVNTNSHPIAPMGSDIVSNASYSSHLNFALQNPHQNSNEFGPLSTERGNRTSPPQGGGKLTKSAGGVLVSIIPSFEFNKESIKQLSLSALQTSLSLREIGFWKGKKVGLALRSGYFVKKSKVSERMEEGIINEVINYLLEQEAEVVLLPHSFHETDDLANDFLFLTKFIGNSQVSIKTNLQEVYKTYKNKEIDFCFAMRLHSIILCYDYEIPFVGVSYSTKTDEVLKELGG